MTISDPIFLNNHPQKNQDQSLKITESTFFNFELSPNQFKIYLYLCKTGVKTASHLSKNLDIPRTETYHLLKILKNKGFISAKNSRPKKFQAVSIENYLQYRIEYEKNKIKKLKDMMIEFKKINTT